MKRIIITVQGSVQGVGFRPFVYRLAKRHNLVGHIKNTNTGVIIDIQGKVAVLEQFQKDLIETKPKRACISEINILEAVLHEEAQFKIEESESKDDTALALLPDTAMCSQCLQELFDPHSRRYRYPFLHCVTCGPRFSLFLRMPFDRSNTTMMDFAMCGQCLKEYQDSDDRRFYSQTNCCPACGPKLQLFDSKKTLLADDQHAIEALVECLKQGKIAAVKNTGGYQLVVDATNEQAVSRLRTLKQRAKKPFALLMPDLFFAKRISSIDELAEQVLTSMAAPIVLLKKKQGSIELAPSVAPESPYYGIMLPHNAIQYLLLSVIRRPLVATSGNISERPLCICEEEAFSELSSVADVFLVHNRRIMHRLDDSIVHMMAQQPVIMRRARGYIPYAISIPSQMNSSETTVLGAGSQFKNSFAFAKSNKIYVGQHIGSLDSIKACQAYDQEVESWKQLLNISSLNGACDKHPGYYTSHYLQKHRIHTHQVQHHAAHVWSGMLDNQLQPPFLSISWDGTGWGDDSTVWGGEAFIVSKRGISRCASLMPFRLPGSEKAIREPRRCALGVLFALFGETIPHNYQSWLTDVFSEEELKILLSALTKGINAPLCSSMGRLFDAVSALLDCCTISYFEGHAALALEALAHKSANDPPRYSIPLLKEKDLWLFDWRSMLNKMFEDKLMGIATEDIALAFHRVLSEGIVKLAQREGLKNILLTGGVMQNKLLAENTIAYLREAGFNPFWHCNIPPNDGGLAVGQIMGSLKRSDHVLSFAG